jgi:hypothetical protein
VALWLRVLLKSLLATAGGALFFLSASFQLRHPGDDAPAFLAPGVGGVGALLIYAGLWL